MVREVQNTRRQKVADFVKKIKTIY